MSSERAPISFRRFRPSGALQVVNDMEAELGEEGGEVGCELGLVSLEVGDGVFETDWLSQASVDPGKSGCDAGQVAIRAEQISFSHLAQALCGGVREVGRVLAERGVNPGGEGLE